MARALDLNDDVEAEKHQIIRYLNDVMGAQREVVTGPNAQDVAVGLANQQQGRWQHLLAFTQASHLQNTVFKNQIDQLREVLIIPTLDNIAEAEPRLLSLE